MATDPMDEQKRAIQAGSFGAAAETYERGRPAYPAEAVSWLLQGTGRRVLDLGAGTGRLTRRLQTRGLDVTAVESSQGMREQLVTAVPQARALDGTAESIPLPDASMDAVLVAEAWHWVDTQRAIPEVARILVPGGVLAAQPASASGRHAAGAGSTFPTSRSATAPGAVAALTGRRRRRSPTLSATGVRRVRRSVAGNGDSAVDHDPTQASRPPPSGAERARIPWSRGYSGRFHGAGNIG